MKVSRLRPTRITPWGVFSSVGSAVSTKRCAIVKYAEFNITGRCPSRCLTCLTTAVYPDEKGTKTVADIKIELARFKKMLRKMKLLGLEFLTIYGREPMLWDKEAGQTNSFLRELISWSSQELNVRVCLATSGIKLNEPVLRTLFDNNGILVMKDWGSQKSVTELMGGNFYRPIQASWCLVNKIKVDYPKIRIIAEFLYTGLNRKDLLPFWSSCLKNNIIPFVETPVISGNCVKNYPSLKIKPEQFVRDIYNLSILNLAWLLDLTDQEARVCKFWEPPYGSVFPMACDKLTKGKNIFLERDGNLSICSGVSTPVGNIKDMNIKAKLQNSILLNRARKSYRNLQGSCGKCEYSYRLHACYGCRGNGYTYSSPTQGIFAEDLMCFGRIAVAMGKPKLRSFMCEKHAAKIMRYFKRSSSHQYS
jgi:radical SAM protein with 4Fe4S-binding SPASM domain